MYHLTLIWLALVGAAFVAGILRGRLIARDANRKIARVEALCTTLEDQFPPHPAIPREHIATIVRVALRGDR